MDSKELSRHAAHVRRNIVKMVTLAQSGHPGGSLSIVDMLQVLYFDVMRIDPKGLIGRTGTASSFPKAIPYRLCMRRWLNGDFSRKTNCGTCASAVLCSKAIPT